jgi:hypothetical protein
MNNDARPQEEEEFAADVQHLEQKAHQAFESSDPYYAHPAMRRWIAGELMALRERIGEYRREHIRGVQRKLNDVESARRALEHPAPQAALQALHTERTGIEREERQMEERLRGFLTRINALIAQFDARPIDS